MSSETTDRTDSGQDQAADVAAVDERRFCSSCSRTKPVLGGVMVRCANGSKRWKCADCHARSKSHMAARQGGSGK